MKKFLLAAVAASVLAGPAFAGATVVGSQDRSAGIMQTPPWWFPIWGTWVSGVNVKICKALDFDTTTNTLTVSNIDGTAVSFIEQQGAGPDAVATREAAAQLRLACDRSDDHDHANWKHRWYKITIGQDATPQGKGIFITKLQGSWNAGNVSLYINDIYVPAGPQIP